MLVLQFALCQVRFTGTQRGNLLGKFGVRFWQGNFETGNEARIIAFPVAIILIDPQLLGAPRECLCRYGRGDRQGDSRRGNDASRTANTEADLEGNDDSEFLPGDWV